MATKSQYFDDDLLKAVNPDFIVIKWCLNLPKIF